MKRVWNNLPWEEVGLIGHNKDAEQLRLHLMNKGKLRNFKPGSNAYLHFIKIVKRSERNERKYSTRDEETYWDIILVG